MATVAEFLKDNINFFDRLVGAGKVSLTVKQELDIYQNWLSQEGSKMERYTKTAEDMGLSETTIRNAVREMKKVI